VTSAVLFPVDERPAVELSEGRWRKMLLPFGTIKLPDGKELHVDRNYVAPVLDAFKQQAFAQVPLQAATDDSQHPDDVERFRGEIEGLEVGSDGLYGIVTTNDDGTKLIKSNKKLGVSVRLLDSYEDHRGRKFGRVLHHVAATLSPRVQGMKPWEAVSLADGEATDTLDLSEAGYEVPPSPVSTGEDSEDTGGGVMSDNDSTNPLQDPAVQEAEDALAAEELAAIDDEVEPDVEPVESVPATQLSDARPSAAAYLAERTELAELRRWKQQQATELAEVRRAFAAERAGREVDQFKLDGVPPSICELALPLLSMPDVPVLELADGLKVSPVAIVRQILTECKGFVELGVRHGRTDNKDSQALEDEMFARWENQSGLRA